jgi:hypothetical protein
MAETAFGLAATDMLAQVCDDYLLDSTKGSVTTRVYRWLNQAQYEMFSMGEWPELITGDDASFTTDGSSAYDLTSELSDALFGKVIDRTVRYGTRNLEPRSKSFFDELDPAATGSGDPLYYCQYNRKDFRIHPHSSIGDTITFDYVKYPKTITAASEATDISFENDRHELIVEGACWRAEKSMYGGTTWIVHRKEWKKEVMNVLSLSRPVRITPKKIVQSW